MNMMGWRGFGTHRDHHPRHWHRGIRRPQSLEECNGDLDEYLAVKTVDFFHEVRLLHGVIGDLCTAQSCPKMCAGAKYEYRWVVGQSVDAPRYFDLLFEWVQAQLDDPNLFRPLGQPRGETCPRAEFRACLQTIFKRLFRVYAHLYYNHFESMTKRGAQAHLNSAFKSFICFALEHDLIPERTQLQPLAPLVLKLCPDAWREYLKRQAKRRWSRLGRIAPAVGGFSALMLALYDEVIYRPGNSGAEQAREHFAALASGLVDWEAESRCHECVVDDQRKAGDALGVGSTGRGSGGSLTEALPLRKQSASAKIAELAIG